MAIPFSELNKINPSSVIELFELELTVGLHVPDPNVNNLGYGYNSFIQDVTKDNFKRTVDDIQNEFDEKVEAETTTFRKIFV